MDAHVGFTGTQRGMKPAQFHAVMGLLSAAEPEWVHHGDCIGADEQFHRTARKLGIKVHGHPPVNDSKRAFCDFDIEDDPLPYLDRNHVIVDSVSLMIATPGEAYEVLRSGTWATIRYSRKTGTDIAVVFPDGEIETEGEI